MYCDTMQPPYLWITLICAFGGSRTHRTRFLRPLAIPIRLRKHCAEGEGLEPPNPEGLLFSRQLEYHSRQPSNAVSLGFAPREVLPPTD